MVSDTDVPKAIFALGDYIVKLSDYTIVQFVANFYRVEEGILNFYNFSTIDKDFIRVATVDVGEWLYVRDA